MKHQAIEVKLRSEFMNVLNVVLSVLVTGIISYFSILNISNSKGNKKYLLFTCQFSYRF